ncbi:MAG: hypothetical protein ACI9OI_002235, partial [Chitinophagales bacterium]
CTCIQLNYFLANSRSLSVRIAPFHDRQLETSSQNQ